MAKLNIEQRREIYEISWEVEEAINEFYIKLSPNPLQEKYKGRAVRYGKGKIGTLVSGYLNPPSFKYLFCAFHILGEYGEEVTVDARRVEFI